MWNQAYGGQRQPQSFDEQYNCYSFAVLDKQHLEGGDKILLPPSALDSLARLHIEYPMLFKLENEATERVTHCGVLEFSAQEGNCFIPGWMMSNLCLEEGSIISVKNVSLPKANYCKLRPQSVDFLDLANPRAVLEAALRNYACLTVGDIIYIKYEVNDYFVEVCDCKPADAVCVIETDCNVDFEPPKGYVEPTYTPKPMEIPKAKSGKRPKTAAELAKEAEVFKAFDGSGYRIDNKKIVDNNKGMKNDSNGKEEQKSSSVSADAPPPVPPTIKGQTLSGGNNGNNNNSSSSSSSSNGIERSTKNLTRKSRLVTGKFSKTKNMQNFTGSGNNMS